MIRVLIADSHVVARRGIERLMAEWKDITVAGTAEDPLEAGRRYDELAPDVVLLDPDFPGPVDGVEMIRRIVADHPDARIVVLTSFPRRAGVRAALEAGATGYLLKDCSADEIASAIRAAARGGCPLDPRVALVVLDLHRTGQPRNVLSEREREVLHFLARGLSNSQIALKLGTSERTVKGHLTRIYRLIGVNGRLNAALWATNNGVADSTRAA